MLFQRVQFVAPKGSVLFDPGRNFLQRIQAGFTKPLPALLPHDDQAALGQDFDVFGNCLPADVERLRYGIQIQWFAGYHMNDFPPGGVGNCLKNVSSHG